MGAVLASELLFSPPALRSAADDGSESDGPLAVLIDPNRDPWWKLAALPNIGVTRARAIVSFRHSAGRSTPFTSADDLMKVKGIGPKTAARLAPLLRFAPE